MFVFGGLFSVVCPIPTHLNLLELDKTKEDKGRQRKTKENKGITKTKR
jgi:hypothetical protein